MHNVALQQGKLLKPNAIIHCENKFSLLERKIFNVLLFNAKNDLKNKDRYKIPLKTLAKISGYNSNDWIPLRGALIKQIKTVVEIDLLDKDNKSKVWMATGLLASVRTLDHAVLEYSYSPVLREILLTEKIPFSEIVLSDLAKFKSKYALALYENCIRYKKINQTPIMDLEIFKKLMGVAPTQYKNFKDFRKRVIDSAIKEINDKTNLNLFVHYMKSKNKVTQIKFFIESCDQVANPWDVEINDILSVMFNFKTHEIKELLDQYSETHIITILKQITATKAYRECKISNFLLYLKYMLKATVSVYANKTCKKVTLNNNQDSVSKSSCESAQLQEQEDFAIIKKYLQENPGAILPRMTKYYNGELELFYLMSITVNKLTDCYAKEGFYNKRVLQEFINYFGTSLNRYFLYIIQGTKNV